MIPIKPRSPKFLIFLAIGILALSIATTLWWRERQDTANEPLAVTDAPPRSRQTAGRSQDHVGETITRIPRRSSNRRVRELSNRLAREFENDTTILAGRLADEDNKYLAFNIGRELIVMFPDKAGELMSAFQATSPPELASYLCGRLVESIAARGDCDEALRLATGLDPGRNRIFAMMGLGSGLDPGSYAKALELVRASTTPEDARRIESGLVNRASDFSVDDLEKLLSLDVEDQTSSVVRNAYGTALIAESGRASALQLANSLPADRREAALASVLDRGAAQEGGPAWLLESLTSLGSTKPDINLDKNSLTIGVAKQMLEKSGDSAMNWAVSIPDELLREATVSGTFRNWLEMNSVEASDWVGKQPQGSIKDLAISDLAISLSSHGDLESARTWLSSMHDPVKKQVLEKRIEILAQGAP